MSYGITATGFNAKRLDAILAEKNAAVQSVFGSGVDLSPQSPDGQINGVLAEADLLLWQLLEEVYNAFNPNAAVGAGLDNLVALNGVTRLPASYSVVTLTASGVDGTVIPAGAQVQSAAGDVFEVYVGGTIASGTVTLLARAVDPGAVAASAGSITSIVTPEFGWTSVTNASDATPGRARETDAELRARRNASVAFASESMVDSIYSAVANVDGVERVVIVENDTDSALGSGQTPHSVRVIVAGGDDDDVAEAIFAKKPAGIEAYGDDPISVLDSRGIAHTIGITRPTDVPIYVRIALTTFSDYPANGADLIKQAIVDYAEGLLVSGQEINLGDDVIYTRLFTPINTVQGHQVDALWISVTDPPTGADVVNLPIAADEVAQFLVANIEVV